MEAYLLDFANMLLRWLHVIAAIAWIGESFYFVMLDNGLRDPINPDDNKHGVFGEMWAVHGGGFYHNQKYTTAPEKLPEHLHWSYLKAYTTWLSGFVLFIVLYLVHPQFYMINTGGGWAWATNLAGWQADVIGVLFLLFGWIIYNELCKRISPTMQRDGLLTIAVAVMMIVVAWLTSQIFSGRAAFLITGAVMGTAMAANVFFWIIPGQRRMVAAMKADEEPDPLDGKRGKQRSVHNTYFTLPVVFLMLSNHYSFMYGGEYAWILMVLFIFAGAGIRQFFVDMHAGNTRPAYLLGGAVIILGTIWVAAPAGLFSSLKANAPATVAASSDSTVGSKQATTAGPSLDKVVSIIDTRCTACHAKNPTYSGFNSPPMGIVLTKKQNIIELRKKIQTVVGSHAMPLGNITHMTKKERQVIAAWQPQAAN